MSTVTPTTADIDTPVLGDTVYALGGGTFLFALAIGALVWVWGALPFVGPASSSSLWPAFGVLAMTLLALLFFVYGWALLARGLTEVIARGVAAGMARSR
jgi:hypothetical protein